MGRIVRGQICNGTKCKWNELQMGRTVRRQIIRGRNLVGTNCKGRIIGRRSVMGRNEWPPFYNVVDKDSNLLRTSPYIRRTILHLINNLSLSNFRTYLISDFLTFDSRNK